MQNPELLNFIGPAEIEAGIVAYTPSQAAELLGVSAKTLANWRCKGSPKLRFVKIGARVRYLPRDILTFVNCRTYGSTSEYAESAKS